MIKRTIKRKEVNMKKLLMFLLLVIAINVNAQQYQLQVAFPNLTFSSALDLQHPGDGTDRIFVVERDGRIKVFPNVPAVPSASVKVYLNITDRVSAGGEMGLLGLAFHPNYASNGYFYVNYTVSSPVRATRISRFSVNPADPDDALENSEVILLSFEQPYTNHNGGQVSFGPDGYLYIATGDGGSGGDPQNNSQNRSNLLGKILRIDVDNPASPLNYGIPPANPFAGNASGFRQEIFAYGLRNPWRFSFDTGTGALWCADVGQGAREEINIITNGGNYGWRCYEGNLTYNTAGCGPQSDYIFPVWDYPRAEGYSVTGGYVYRGPNLPGLYGKYIYGDYGSRKIWSLDNSGSGSAVNTLLLIAPGSITSFGTDLNQELYVVSFDGKIYRFTPTATIIAPSNLQASLQTDNNGNWYNLLSWNDNSNNETGFRIERRTGNGNFTVLNTVPSNTTTYNDYNLDNNTGYTYRVSAFSATDNSGNSNTVTLTTGVVPVEFIAFTGSVEGNLVALKWSTGSELNNKGFEVERFLQGNWISIGSVPGRGTTPTGGNYEFYDNWEGKSYTGTVAYRIKQSDFDGTVSYSSELLLDLTFGVNTFYLAQNYPNPFNPSTTIAFFLPEESKVKLTVVNTLGEVVKILVDETKGNGLHDVTWNSGNNASGIYFIKIETEAVSGRNSYSKIIKASLLR
jgi:glucose/arabinose dehydrogenase